MFLKDNVDILFSEFRTKSFDVLSFQFGDEEEQFLALNRFVVILGFFFENFESVLFGRAEDSCHEGRKYFWDRDCEGNHQCPGECQRKRLSYLVALFFKSVN